MGMFLYALFFHCKSPSALISISYTLPLEHELKPLAGINEAQAYDQSPPDEEKPHQGENLEKHDRPPYHDNSGSSVEEEPEVFSELTLSTFRSTRQKKKGKKAAASGWGIPAAEEAPVLVDEPPASEDASPAPVHVTHGIWVGDGLDTEGLDFRRSYW